jgi:hypothetical protein
VAGAPLYLDKVRARFEGGPLDALAQRSLALQAIGRRFAREPSYAGRIEVDALAAQVVEAYVRSARVVDALARDRGVRVVRAWQPWIGSCKKPDAEAERRIRARVDPALTRLFEAVEARVFAAVPGLHDLRGALDGLPAEQVWIDFFHLTPEGNRAIAARLAPLVRD